jgi:DNA-binding IscR family transcriptional regulator
MPAHAEKARAYLASHKVVDKNKMARILGLSLSYTNKVIKYLEKTVKVWTINSGKDGRGGGWQLAGETVREL